MAWLKAQGVIVERGLIDNCFGYQPKDFQAADAETRALHLRTSSKAERLILTMPAGAGLRPAPHRHLGAPHRSHGSGAPWVQPLERRRLGPVPTLPSVVEEQQSPIAQAGSVFLRHSIPCVVYPELAVRLTIIDHATRCGLNLTA